MGFWDGFLKIKKPVPVRENQVYLEGLTKQDKAILLKGWITLPSRLVTIQIINLLHVCENELYLFADD